MKMQHDVNMSAETGVAPPPDHRQWLIAHALEIGQYNAWAVQRQPYAQRVRQWRQSQERNLDPADGAV